MSWFKNYWPKPSRKRSPISTDSWGDDCRETVEDAITKGELTTLTTLDPVQGKTIKHDKTEERAHEHDNTWHGLTITWQAPPPPPPVLECDEGCMTAIFDCLDEGCSVDACLSSKKLQHAGTCHNCTRSAVIRLGCDASPTRKNGECSKV